jgi:hypothetical protein
MSFVNEIYILIGFNKNGNFALEFYGTNVKDVLGLFERTIQQSWKGFELNHPTRDTVRFNCC